MNPTYTVAILGCGNRGAETYGTLFTQQAERFRITALCDTSPYRLEVYGRRFGVSETFTDEARFFEKKRADLLVIATMDRDHVRQCVRAFRLGYDVLLEKPVSADREELEELLRVQRETGRKALVCHVLRYAPAYLTIGQYLKRGAIGRLVAIQTIEQVAYWHQAHSFVRGNWHSSEETAPMILAKCCHDLDLLQYFAGARCESVSSVGDLAYFKAECAPEAAQKRCVVCPLVETCAYSAKRIYVDGWKAAGRPASDWPYVQLTSRYPITEEALEQAIETGEYGRCVYFCDNDVVDHQIADFTFENGVKASLTMTAFTADCGRVMRLFGTLGEIVLDEPRGEIVLKPFGGAAETVRIASLENTDKGHGGGEYGLLDTLYGMLCGETEQVTSLENSVESHLMAICAEESRRRNGARIAIHAKTER